MAAHPVKLIEDPQGMMFEYLHQGEAEFLYEVRKSKFLYFTGRLLVMKTMCMSMSFVVPRSVG